MIARKKKEKEGEERRRSVAPMISNEENRN